MPYNILPETMMAVRFCSAHCLSHPTLNLSSNKLKAVYMLKPTEILMSVEEMGNKSPKNKKSKTPGGMMTIFKYLQGSRVK